MKNTLPKVTLYKKIIFLMLFVSAQTQLVAQVTTGDTAVYSGTSFGSCFFPEFDSATIYVTIPGGMAVTGLYFQSSFNTNVLNDDIMSDGIVYFKTPCDTTYHIEDTTDFFPGTINFWDSGDSTLISCLTPSCSPQTFPVTMFLSRIYGGAGCNADYIYYNPTDDMGASNDALPFKACVMGVPMNGSPVAKFSIAADPNQLHHYIVTDSSTFNGTASYDWSWGDGTHDYTPNPSHIYSNAGFYDICLTVTDQSGCKSTFCDNSFHALRTTNTMVYMDVVSIPTGIQISNSLSQQVTAYPNPANNLLAIHTSSLRSNETVTVSILNMLGETMLEEKQKWISDMTFKIEDLPAGIYFLQMKSENEHLVKKFVKE